MNAPTRVQIRHLQYWGFVFVVGSACTSASDGLPNAGTAAAGSPAVMGQAGTSPQAGGPSANPAGGSGALGGSGASGSAGHAGAGDGAGGAAGGSVTSGTDAGGNATSGTDAGGTPSGAGTGTSPMAGSGGSDAPDAGTGALPKRVLLYHFSTLAIDSVPAQLSFFQTKLAEWGYESEASVVAADISDQNLQRFAAVAMINTCFEPFGKGQPDRPQSEVLQRFLQRGGGLFGTHCASVTFQNKSPPALYNQVLGGRGGNGSFEGSSACRTLLPHPTTASLGATFSFVGNLDNSDYIAPDAVVLVKCTWQTANGRDVNVSWTRTEGSGRVFYSNFAKVAADLSSPVLGAHITAGLSWVLQRP